MLKSLYIFDSLEYQSAIAVYVSECYEYKGTIDCKSSRAFNIVRCPVSLGSELSELGAFILSTMSENVVLIKKNTSDAFPHPLSDLRNLKESLFQRTNPGVDLGFGSAPLIFILVLICLILLLSIIVTLLCCLKAQISDNIQTATSNKTWSSRGIQTKPSRTEDIQPSKNVRIYY